MAGEVTIMPKIYTNPSQIRLITDSQRTGATTEGNLSNIFDGTKYTFYQTDSAGTSGVLEFVINLVNTETVDTIYLIGQNISTVRVDEFGCDYVTNPTFNDRVVSLGTTASPISTQILTLQCTRTSGATDIRIYQILVMSHLLDLNQSDTRVITRFNTVRQIRNAFVQEDLYGSRTLQTGHINNPKKRINYQMWQNANTLSEARSELNRVYDIQRQNPNFTLWDLDEPNSQDYESVFPAFWVPNSFTELLQGTQAISYALSVEEQ